MIYAPPETRGQGRIEDKASDYSSFSDSWTEASTQGLTQKALTWADEYIAQPLGLVPDEGHLSFDQASSRLAERGVSFEIPEGGMSVRTFNLFAERDLQRLRQDSRRDRATSRSFLAGLAGGIAGSLTDPLTLIASYAPVSVGASGLRYGAAHIEARTLATAQAGSWLGRLGTRVKYGSQEAFAGSLAYEYANLGVSSAIGEQDTVNPVAGVLIGTLAGTTFDAGLGGLIDITGYRSPREAQALLEFAASQALRDRPVNVGTLSDAFDTFLGAGDEAALAARRGEPIPDVQRVINPEDLVWSRSNPERDLKAGVMQILGAGGRVLFDSETLGVSSGQVLGVVADALVLKDRGAVPLAQVFDPRARARISLDLPGEKATQVARAFEQSSVRPADEITPAEQKTVADHLADLEELGEPVPREALVEHVDADSADWERSIAKLREEMIAAEKTPEEGAAILEAAGLGKNLDDELKIAKSKVDQIDEDGAIVVRALPCATGQNTPLAGGES